MRFRQRRRQPVDIRRRPSQYAGWKRRRRHVPEWRSYSVCRWLNEADNQMHGAWNRWNSQPEAYRMCRFDLAFNARETSYDCLNERLHIIRLHLNQAALHGSLGLALFLTGRSLCTRLHGNEHACVHFPHSKDNITSTPKITLQVL
jgi:hypothetical protein